MATHIKPQAKIFLAVLFLLAVVFGFREAAMRGLIPVQGIAKALVPAKANLPDVRDAQVSNVAPVTLPTTTPATIQNTLVRGEIWEWNAQLGLLYATGGPATTVGSLMAKRNVNLMLARQDDTNKMQEDLIACANELKTSGQTQCSNGANFVVIMGDGSGQFAAAVNPQLAKLGPAYLVKVIAATGYSRGEDSFLAPPNVKANPKSYPTSDQPGTDTKGVLVEGVLRDGDWNIAMKWASDNNIPNNPDEHTYDPNAINWVNAPDYNTAASDYVANKCEERKVVDGGRPTGKTVKACVNAVVTWTPGDVTAVTQKGGLVKVVSSKQYRSQMPAVIIGPAKFFADNRDEITNLVAAMFEGGDQVKAYDQALKAASLISTKVYNDEGDNQHHGGSFWYDYYKGVDYKDTTTGTIVPLGGSAVNNLDDNLILFGMKTGANDNFRSTYNVFAGIDMQQYPTLFKETPIPDVSTIEDRSFIKGASDILTSSGESGSEAQTVDFTSEASGSAISSRSYNINFETGSGVLTPAGQNQLRQLKDGLAITGLFIKVDGYTDNTGSDTINIPLSAARAASVKQFLQHEYPGTFPTSRFQTAGHGSQDPIADNGTTDGKAQNRRVTITLVGNN